MAVSAHRLATLAAWRERPGVRERQRAASRRWKANNQPRVIAYRRVYERAAWARRARLAAQDRAAAVRRQWRETPV